MEPLMPGPEPVRRFAPQLVIGVLIIVVGLIFTLNNVGLLDSRDYLRYWPVVLIAIGLMNLWRGGGSAFNGFLFLFAGAWLLLQAMRVVSISLWSLWPILLVVAGASMVWRVINTGRSGGAAGDPHSTISALAVLGGVHRGNSSKAFKGGDLTAVLGGCEIDLRQAGIEGDAVIDVFAMWGGIEIRVPENWTVSGHVTPVLGGYEDKTTAIHDGTNQRLLVRGMVVMGGVEIKN